MVRRPSNCVINSPLTRAQRPSLCLCWLHCCFPGLLEAQTYGIFRIAPSSNNAMVALQTRVFPVQCLSDTAAGHPRFRPSAGRPRQSCLRKPGITDLAQPVFSCLERLMVKFSPDGFVWPGVPAAFHLMILVQLPCTSGLPRPLNGTPAIAFSAGRTTLPDATSWKGKSLVRGSFMNFGKSL